MIDGLAISHDSINFNLLNLSKKQLFSIANFNARRYSICLGLLENSASSMVGSALKFFLNNWYNFALRHQHVHLPSQLGLRFLRMCFVQEYRQPKRIIMCYST